MNKKDIKRNAYMLTGSLARQGYDWWWHSFTAYHHVTGEAKQFYIEFFVMNPALSNGKIHFGSEWQNQRELMNQEKLKNQEVLHNGELQNQQKLQDDNQNFPSYVMVNVGTWGENKCQLHRFFPSSELIASKDRLNVEIGDCILTEHYTCGKVSVSAMDAKGHPEYLSDSGAMEWNLKIDKRVAFHVGYGASAFFRKIAAFDMFWHAQGMKTFYEGTICFNGEAYDVIPEKSYGYADKNWGRDFTSPWVWISSCHMKSLLTGETLHNSVFDIGGGCPVVFGIPIKRKLLSALWYEGEDLEFNFSKFWTCTKTTFDFIEKDDLVIWKIKTRNRNAMLLLECHCPKNDMLKIRYQSPDGQMRHKNLFNGGNGYGVFKLYKKYGKSFELVDKVAFHSAGCEYGEYE